MRSVLLSTVLLVVVTCTRGEQNRQNQTWPTRTYPGQIGYPTTADVYKFIKAFSGSVISPLDTKYANVTLMHNIRVTQLPDLVVFPKTIEDVQVALLFARQFNLHTSIRSSGHDYIGRSTHAGSININMAKMKDISIDVGKTSRHSAGEIKVQTGASWIEVYEKVDGVKGPDMAGSKQVGRVVVGGSAHTVAMGGYTQGGGHSPIGRKFSLAVDNVLEITIVTADGKVRILNATATVTRDLDGSVSVSSDTSLFWAVRGGGGGTWGVVVDFTYKLHYAPERFRNVLVYFPLKDDKGRVLDNSTIQSVLQEVNKLSEDWGGYFMISGSPVPGTKYVGTITLFLNHYGTNTSASNKDVDKILSHPSVLFKDEHYYNSFLGYEVNAKDPLLTVTYIASSLIQPSSIENVTSLNSFVELILDLTANDIGCTGTLIGGNMGKAPAGSTPVHPGFRSGIMALTCGGSWPYDPMADDAHIDKILKKTQALYSFGYGSYFNEPAADIPDWKTMFWADDANYQRLLEVKKKYDPDNYFWCHNCVGSDLGQGYGPPESQGIPGRPAMTYFHPTRDWNQINIPTTTFRPVDVIIG